MTPRSAFCPTSMAGCAPEQGVRRLKREHDAASIDIDRNNGYSFRRRLAGAATRHDTPLISHRRRQLTGSFLADDDGLSWFSGRRGDAISTPPVARSWSCCTAATERCVSAGGKHLSKDDRRSLRRCEFGSGTECTNAPGCALAFWCGASAGVSEGVDRPERGVATQKG